MTTRRGFLRRSALAALGAGAAALPRRAGALATAPRPRALRVLVLGGTGFLGPHLIHVATSRGHAVSMLNRGRREPGMYEEDFAGVEAIEGDRSRPDGLDGLRGRTWDVVVETSGYSVDWTRDAVAALRGSVGRWLYVSSTGVFWPYRTTRIPEDGPIPLVDDPPQDPPSYGVMKARSEAAVREGFEADALIVRPGYIVGPGDLSDRWTYWPVRVARGGEIPVPGRRTDPVQYVDVRDLSEWMIRLLEDGVSGTFNATGPARRQTMEEFVYGLGATTSAPLSWTWIDDYAFLKAYPLTAPATGGTVGLTESVPWILPEGDELGHMQIDTARALAAGLTLRPLAETATDTVRWRLSEEAPAALRERPRYVLTPAQEEALLEAWRRVGGRP